jgi:hypothetical protein
MAALLRQLALVSQSAQISSAEVRKVSAAIQKQASRDLAPIWEISATVDSFDTLEDVPVGYWPIIVMDNIQTPGAEGVHEDKNGQPFALVTAEATLDRWSLTASHEALEMLVDPFGNRQVAGDSPKANQGRVSFLVEVADPSEAADFAYSSNGVLVSDFYTPHFFDPMVASGVRYSFTGAITAPRKVLKGGYLSWLEPVSGHWWQEVWFDAAPSFRDLGPVDGKASGNIRAAIDRMTTPFTLAAMSQGRSAAGAAGLTASANCAATTSYASLWREQIAHILGKGTSSAEAHALRARPAPSVY